MIGEFSFKCKLCEKTQDVFMRSKWDWPTCCGQQMERDYKPTSLNMANGTNKDINQRIGQRNLKK